MIEAALPALTVISFLGDLRWCTGRADGGAPRHGRRRVSDGGYLLAFWGCACRSAITWLSPGRPGRPEFPRDLTAGLVVVCVMLGWRFAVVARRRRAGASDQTHDMTYDIAIIGAGMAGAAAGYALARGSGAPIIPDRA